MSALGSTVAPTPGVAVQDFFAAAALPQPAAAWSPVTNTGFVVVGGPGPAIPASSSPGGISGGGGSGTDTLSRLEAQVARGGSSSTGAAGALDGASALGTGSGPGLRAGLSDSTTGGAGRSGRTAPRSPDAGAPARDGASAGASSALRERVIAKARSQVGVRETGGEDRGAEIRRYTASVTGSASDGQAWCAFFASWVFNEVGAPLMDSNGDGLVKNLGDWSKRSGRFRDKAATPRPGDLVLFKNRSDNGRWTDHIGIVESVDPNGTIHTIEGNASDSVRRNTYAARHPTIVGFISAD